MFPMSAKVGRSRVLGRPAPAVTRSPVIFSPLTERPSTNTAARPGCSAASACS